jgi:hypothetical protein
MTNAEIKEILKYVEGICKGEVEFKSEIEETKNKWLLVSENTKFDMKGLIWRIQQGNLRFKPQPTYRQFTQDDWKIFMNAVFIRKINTNIYRCPTSFTFDGLWFQDEFVNFSRLCTTFDMYLDDLNKPLTAGIKNE